MPMEVFHRVIKRLHKNRKGLETVELAINLPVILYLVFASIVFTLAIFAKIVVIDAAREGARAAAITVDADRTAAATEAINSTLTAGGLNPGRIETGYPIINIQQNIVEVEIVYNQPSLVPGLPRLIKGEAWGDNFQLKAVSIFKKEQL